MKFRRIVLSVVLLLAIGGLSIALIYIFPSTPTKVKMATPFGGSGYYIWAKGYQERFARANIELELHPSNGAVHNMELLRDHRSGVQIAWGVSGILSEPPDDLYSLGNIPASPCLLFYIDKGSLTDLEQFKGKRIAVGPIGGAQRVNAEKVFDLAGINAENTIFLPLNGDAAAEALRDGRADAWFNLAGNLGSGAQASLKLPDIKLFNFESAKALTKILPQFSFVELPRGIIDFQRKIPDHDISVLSLGNQVIIRRDLHPGIVALLLETMTLEHNGATVFQKRGEYPNTIASEFNLAPAAADFYRNGASLIHRVFPLWMTSHVQRAAVVLFAIVPFILFVISYEPLIYRWIIRERVRRFYRKLKTIENRLTGEWTVEQLGQLSEEIEAIDREAMPLKIPLRHSDSYFSVKVHINLIRTRLNAKITEARAKQQYAVN